MAKFMPSKISSMNSLNAQQVVMTMISIQHLLTLMKQNVPHQDVISLKLHLVTQIIHMSQGQKKEFSNLMKVFQLPGDQSLIKSAIHVLKRKIFME